MELPYRFGRYVLLKKVAQGGMAEIFKAKYLGESGFSKDVCIKRLLPVWSDNPHFTKMLIDEAKALVHLTHPNIVQVYELGRDGKTLYISMELVGGVDLRKLFLKIAEEGHPLPLKFILYVIGAILKALRFAHQRKDEEGRALKIVHRDISPQNILISFDGEVKVADFGIAKGMHRSLETTQHQVKGKYAYMSPEQARGEPVDERTDVYATGILLFELLERRRLFDSANDLATLEKARAARLPEEALQNCFVALREAVLKALQREKGDRYACAGDFLHDLQRIIAEEDLATNAEEFAEYLRTVFPPAVTETLAEGGWQPAGQKGCFSPLKQISVFLSALFGLSLPFAPSPVSSPASSPPPTLPATLKVSARPWGEVTIPGVLDGRETPVAGLKLRSGTYRVQVFYPPQNKTVERVIHLAGGTEFFCQAEFGPTSTLQCR